MIAARHIFLGRGAGAKVPTAADYVMTGLVAMWDGIENAGWGTHEDSPFSFVDLVSGYNLNQTGSASSAFDTIFSENALQGKAYNILSYNVPSALLTAIVGASRSVEFVFTRDSLSNTVGFPVFISGNWMSFAGFVGARLLLYHQGNGFYVDPPSQTAPYKMAITMSVASGVASVYVNGQKVNTVSAGSMSTPTSASNVVLGQNLNLVNNTSYFAAKTHSVRIYAAALSDAQVSANFAIDNARFSVT